jgi:hypothetical protein
MIRGDTGTCRIRRPTWDPGRWGERKKELSGGELLVHPCIRAQSTRRAGAGHLGAFGCTALCGRCQLQSLVLIKRLSVNSGHLHLSRVGCPGRAGLREEWSRAAEVAVPGCPGSGRPGKPGAPVSPTETPQVGDTVADPQGNPTDETAHSGTLVMRVKGTENSRSAASMRVSWAVGAFSRYVLSG